MTSLSRLIPATLLAATGLLGSTALADMTLPSPYISRALDAVLLPIDDTVIAGFALHPDETGALVLAVQPGGTAEAYGVLPGDVVSFVGGVPISSPIDLDTIVYFWISQGTFDFVFDGYRGADAFNVVSVISSESYYEVIEISSVESWSSYSYESFSYSEYYAEYSSEMTETYESSETMIEETASSEEFMAEVEAVQEESMSEESMSEESMAEEDMAEEDMADEDGDGVMDEEAMDDGEAVAEDEAMDDSEAVDDGGDVAAEEEPAEDEAVEDEQAEEEAVEEDAPAEE